MMMSDPCILCGGDDPLASSVCPECRATGSGGRLVFVRPPRDPDARRQLTDRLAGLFGEHLAHGELDDVATGTRALLRVPVAGTPAALGQLAACDIPTHAVSARAGVAPLPITFHAVTVGVIALGMTAGYMVQPSMIWVSPIVAVLLFVGAQVNVRRPSIVPNDHARVFHPRATDAITAALDQLPAGRARQTLATLTAVARELCASLESTDIREELDAVLVHASEAAIELADLDAHIERFSARDLPGDARSVVERCGAARDELVDRLGDAVTLLGQARSRHLVSNAHLGSELVALARNLERHTARYATAVREIRACLAEAPA